MVGRVWILLLVTAFTCAIPAHAEQTAAKGQSGQSAWVYDLPGVVAAKGTRVEIAGPVGRRQEDKRLTLVIVGGSPVVGQFAELQGKQRTLPRLRIVERAAGSVDKDTEYSFHGLSS